MQTNTIINGLSHATSNSVCEDGDCFMLVNLRKKNQSLRPVTNGTPIAEVKENYDIIYIHPNNTVNNWIGVKDNKVYENITDAPSLICTLDTTIQKVQNIGNTLILFTELGFYYLLYKNNTYKKLGYKAPFPYCKIQCQISTAKTDFTDIEGTITDIQAAMEAIIVKNRWKEESASKLCGAYMVRYALRLYDNSYILHSNPVLLYPCVSPYTVTLAYNKETFIPEHSFVTAVLYNASIEFNLSALKEWSDVILSVDIFISKELGVITEEFREIEDATIKETEPDRTHPYHLKTVTPLTIDSKKIIEQIEQIDNFYLVCSIPVNSENTTVTFPEKSLNLQNLIHQPTLGIDNFSHHNLTASNSYCYNQRLHIANIKTFFFDGFDFRAFVPEKDTTGYRPTNQTEPVQKLKAEKAYIQYYINAQNEESYVVTKTENINYIKINPLICYPDTRAYKAVITLTDKYDNILKRISLDLKPHSNLNIAYFINPSLQEILLIPVLLPQVFFFTPSQKQIKEENKIKVSSALNPFVFPNENTYITGNGKVVGMAANSTPVSEGQFGQFPLYVFTDEGIYILSVGSGNIVYSNVSPISEEIALEQSIKSVIGAVFFLTLRGAFIISGSKVISISDTINTHNIQQNLQVYEQIHEIIFQHPIRITPFLQFIQKDNISVHFNYTENEVLIINKNIGHTYVYNFDTRHWYTTTYTFSPVENCFPQLYGISGKQILDIGKEVNSVTPVILLTRPMKYSTQQYKNLIRHILRSNLSHPDNIGFFTYSSNDATYFRLKTNKRIGPGTHRDIDTGLISCNKYRYFAILLIGHLNKDSYIDFLTSVFYPVYTNDKAR